MKNNLFILTVVSLLVLSQARTNYFKKIFEDKPQEAKDWVQRKIDKHSMKEQVKQCFEANKNNSIEVDSDDFGSLSLYVNTDECKNGLSSANVDISSTGSVEFKGEVLLGEHGFGFVSLNTIKKEESLFTTDISSINLKVKGDGQKYIFSVSYNDDFFAPTWAQVFTAPEASTDIELLLEDFTPFNRIANETEFDIKNVKVLSISLVLSNGEKWNRDEKEGERNIEKERHEIRGHKGGRSYYDNEDSEELFEGENEEETQQRRGKKEGHVRRRQENQDSEFLGRKDGHERGQRNEDHNEKQERNHQGGRRQRNDDNSELLGRRDGHERRQNNDDDSELFGRKDGHERRQKNGDESDSEMFGRKDGHERRQRNEDHNGKHERNHQGERKQRNDDDSELLGRRDGHERRQNNDDDSELFGRKDGHERRQRNEDHNGQHQKNERKGRGNRHGRNLEEDQDEQIHHGKWDIKNHGHRMNKKGGKDELMMSFFEALSENIEGPFHLEIEDLSLN